MFELQPLDPDNYRQQTRKSSLILIVLFAATGMLLSSLLVLLWGTPGGNNFRLNLLGVALSLGSTLLLVRFYLKDQPFMREAVYGWHLKRNLMRVTNVMHRVKPLAETDHPRALQILRFYQLALEQMHQLEGNDTGLLELKVEKQQTAERMQALGLDPNQTRLDARWISELQDRTTA
ncbi:DUF3087 family protein [Marinospirillum alkaliphilum]|uniref:DUF3087 domain-containing protein n=1 Tax=Marinospirillum alkaliphilum DSM 21637 TaxID=1122209 RepID=A0A1K1W8S3_9GAMM|nr:DUF3087 family protein [Marinospirillum alkaliphilum]SFX33768.1 Protein of unknown function [Marinospirillum alkaliphilum DSM 21637]